MRRIKIGIPHTHEIFKGIEWLIEAIEWTYGDTYFIIGMDIVKLIEVKFKEVLMSAMS